MVKGDWWLSGQGQIPVVGYMISGEAECAGDLSLKKHSGDCIRSDHRDVCNHHFYAIFALKKKVLFSMSLGD